MDYTLDFVEESLTIGVERLREVNELVLAREQEVAEAADGLAESVDLPDSLRERLRSGAERLRDRSPEFLGHLRDLEADLRTATVVGQTTEADARVASWRGTDRLSKRLARLGEQVLLRWMHLDRVERLILQLLGESDLRSIGVTEFPWPERRKPSSDQRSRTEKQSRRWWPFGSGRDGAETNAALDEAFRVLDGAADQSRDTQASD